MWYIVLFSLLAVLLIVAGAMAMGRNRRGMSLEGDPVPSHHPSATARQQRKAKRTQSKQARRKRH